MINFLETEKKLKTEDISDFENRVDYKLPEEYKDHLLKYNGGRCKPSGFIFKENDKISESSVDWFLALYDGEYDSLERYFYTYKFDSKRMPDNFFPIAHDAGGNLICMEVSKGGIYFWDHENEPIRVMSEPNIPSNLHFISDSLNDFLLILSDNIT